MIEKVIVHYQNENDIGMLEDLIRSYMPGVLIENRCYTASNVEKGVDESLALKGNVVIYLDENQEKSEVCLSLYFKQKIFEQKEKPQLPLLAEEGKNRRRRLFRLALHKIISRMIEHKVLTGTISPWGGLTGVRPTKIAHRLFAQDFTKDRIIMHLHRDFGLSIEKARMLTEIAVIQRPYLLTEDEASKLVGIYIGIPFCPTRCHYCSFPAYSMQRWGKYLDEYLTGLSMEINGMGNILKENNLKVHSVYLGGGTPTVLTSTQIDSLVNSITSAFDLVDNAELTVEGGRPDTLDLAKLQVLKKWGITRLSINPQTMHDSTLNEIGRKHSVEDVINCYMLAKKVGFPVINMDLIIGLPGENRDMVKATLKEVLSLAPENVTLHALAIKRAAKFNQEGFVQTPQNEGQIMMDVAQNALQEAGYLPYYLYRQKNILAHGENVGYTQKGYQCIYNILMMEERQTILGLGVGASSKFVNPVDWSLDTSFNPKDLFVYLSRVEELIMRKVDKLNSIVYNNC